MLLCWTLLLISNLILIVPTISFVHRTGDPSNFSFREKAEHKAESSPCDTNSRTDDQEEKYFQRDVEADAHCAASDKNQDPYYRLFDEMKHVVPYHYDIELTQMKDQYFESLAGISRIKLNILKRTESIVFHYSKVMLKEIKLFDPDEVAITGYHYHCPSRGIEVMFDPALRPGRYILELTFCTILNETESFEEIRFPSQNGLTESIGVTHMQPFALELFPCLDEPEFKSTFSIGFTHDSAMRIISNMPIKWQEHMENMTTRTEIHETPAIPINRVVLIHASIDFLYDTDQGKNNYIWSRYKVMNNLLHALTVMEQLWPKFNERAKISPQRISHVVLPYSEKRYGYYGVCIYTEADLFYLEVDPIAQKINMIRAIGNALADQLFSNVIPPNWWSNLWMTKGITGLISLDVLNETFPELRMKELFVVQTLHESLHLDTENVMNPLMKNMMTRDEINSMFSSPFHMKAPVIMRMLEHIMPPNMLLTELASFVHHGWPKLLRASTFWDFMQFLLNRNEKFVFPNKETNLEELMKSWIEQKHYPVVNVERNYATGQIKLSQRLFQNVTVVGNWWIPITILKQTKENLTTTTSLWLSPSEEKIIDIGSVSTNDNWIVLNPHQIGYYRVNYDTRNWMLIANYLNSENYTHIHTLNRAQLIDDAYHLLMTNQLDRKVFFKLTEYLSQDTDYVAWYPMFKIFEHLSTFLPFAESKPIKEHMLYILRGLIVNIDLEEKDEDTDLTKMLRQNALRWACTFGCSICKEIAMTRLREHVDIPNWDIFRNYTPVWYRWMYYNGISTANLDTWNRTIHHLEEQHRIEDVHELFSYSEDPAIIINTLKQMLHAVTSKNHTTPPLIYTKPWKVISSIVAKHAATMLQDILAHLKTIQSKEHVIKLLAITIYHLYSIDQLKTVNEFAVYNFDDEVVVASIQHLLNVRVSRIQNRLTKLETFGIKRVNKENDFTFKPSSRKEVPLQKLLAKEELIFSQNFLPTNILPLHYDIKLIMPKQIGETLTFDGECNVTIVIRRVTQEICLHSLEQRIRTASLIHISSLDHSKIYHCTKIAQDSTKEILILTFQVSLLPGIYILSVKFQSSLSDNGNGDTRNSLYKNGNGTRVLLFTKPSQPIRARRVFPCWDEPSLRSTFNISINHDPKYRPLTNMPIRKVQTENGTIWTHFSITPTMSTYHMAIVITTKDMYRISNIKQNINIWCRMLVIPHMSFAYTVAETVMLDLLSCDTGSMKIPKMDHLAIPEIPEDTIGNWGLNIYNEAAILYDEQLDTVAHKIDVARLMARAVAQQLLNNLTSPSWLSQPWLNEGLPVFLGTYAIDKNLISPRALELFVVQLHHESLHLDVNHYMSSLSIQQHSSPDMQSLFSYPFYVKAPAIIRMLHYAITNIFFVESDVYTNFENKQLKVSYDICAAMESALRLRELDTDETDYTLKDVIHTWITESNYPIINVTRDYKTGHVMVSQETNGAKKWLIPITYATQKKPYFSNILSVRWLKPELENIILDGIDQNPGWIVVNLQQIGYYRVNYDRTNWMLLSEYLNSNEFEKIHVLNRAQIIDDAYHLTMERRLDYKIFLNLVEYLSQETDYIAWYPMFKILEYTSSFLPFKESQPLKSHMIRVLRGLVARIGYDEYHKEKDFLKCLRQEAIKWACNLGDVNCKMLATEKLEDHLQNPAAHRLLPGWKHWTYCAGLKLANDGTCHKAWNVMLRQGGSHNKALNLMSCSETPSIVCEILEILLSDNATAKSSNYISVIYSFIAIHARNNLEDILEYLRKYNVLDISKTLAIIINYLYTEEEIQQVIDFISDYYAMDKETINDITYLTETRLARINYHLGKFSVFS